MSWGNTAHGTPWGYTDYGKPRDAKGRITARWIHRPHCDMCGPFRGRYLRRLFDGEYRCRGCDEE